MSEGALNNTNEPEGGGPAVHRPTFQELGGGHRGEPMAENRLEMVLNIPVTLSMEIGRTTLSIRHLLELTPGSVVKLERPVGEPLDIMVNGCLIARGEVVIVNEKFGMRITDIVSPEERMKKLR